MHLASSCSRVPSFASGGLVSQLDVSTYQAELFGNFQGAVSGSKLCLLVPRGDLMVLFWKRRSESLTP